MVPDLTEGNRAFWTGGVDGRLHVPFCDRCTLWVLPAAASCPNCGRGVTSLPTSGLGTVFSYTVNHHPYNPAVAVPYVIAIVELVEHRALRIAANIIDCEPESVTIGMPVAVRFEQHVVADEVVFVPVFAPRQQAS